MYALVDCNHFFVSCERLFRPDLRNHPVCVLSNNDGCVVSLSHEAKILGIKRGVPLFQIADIVKKNNIAIFSSNYLLYSGISERVMKIITDTAKNVDVYSIDEAFIDLRNYEKKELVPLMRLLAEKIKKWVGIPVSIGVAPTKTLAKVAAHYAKKYKGYKQVCCIDDEQKRVKALSTFDIADVWGIGRQFSKKLASFGVNTAYDFIQKKEFWVQKHFTIMGVRAWKELQGIPTINTTEINRKQSICTSRSFGTTVTDIESLKESIAHFTAMSAQKLRKQNSVANIISVFILTDRFSKQEEHYYHIRSMALPVGTDDTAELILYAHQLLNELYKRGKAYKKSGVILSCIVPNSSVQQNMFDNLKNREKRSLLNKVVDNINSKSGLNSVKYAAQISTDKKWTTKTSFKSPDYLTNINELFEVH
ncbi:MAG TPA: Y-family DNA polymerase [Bacteroidales bacterium]|nr:Y-family DNA polymerase [Bacteroidales bacterium]